MFNNRLLDGLAGDAQDALRPHLVRVSLSDAQPLIAAGRPVATAHFPVTCQLANVVSLRNGGQTEVSAIGSEGVSGLAPVLAGKPAGWDVVVRQPGEAWAVQGAVLARVARESAALMDHLLVLAGFYQAQASVSAACIAHHPVFARLARFLLTAADLSPDMTLQMTQDDLARALGATRSTVNPEAAFLKEAGAVAYSRGRIRILDRRQLERQACECYGNLRAFAERDGLLPPRAS